MLSPVHEERSIFGRRPPEPGRYPFVGGITVKWVLIIIGVLVLAVGVIWFLQGTNVLPYGQMAGHRRWIVIGGGLGIIGIILIIVGARMRKAKAA
jgi:hypothetical protein